MSSVRRSGSRRDYRHFPSEYAELIQRFDRDGHASLPNLTKAEAQASVRDLYRFRMYLSEALDADSEDVYARALFNMFNSITLKVVGPRCQRPAQCTDAGFGPKQCSLCSDTGYSVNFTRNPIVAAVRRSRGDAL